MKGKWKYVVYTLLGLVLAYILLTPHGAIRTAVLFTGHPGAAVTMGIREAAAEDVGLKKLDNPSYTKIYRVEGRIPVDYATGAELLNWTVTWIGPLCVATYYGWC